MRRRVVLVAVALALCIGTLTLAQPAGDPARLQESRNNNLRNQIARLRAEVELSQIEHEIDVQLLKDLLKEFRETEAMNSVKTEGPSQAPPAPKAVAGGDVNAPNAGEDPKKQAQDGEAFLKSMGPLLEQKKKELLEKTVQLNQQELQLEDLESQRRGGK